jgi:predicted ABC-class ATPase
MQSIQNLPLPPSVKGLEDINEVTKLTEIKPVKSVPERTQPSLVFRPSTRAEYQHNLIKTFERRNAEIHLDRRTICRRIKTQPLLKELRSKVDRRRHTQRKTDITEHIDEDA